MFKVNDTIKATTRRLQTEAHVFLQCTLSGWSEAEADKAIDEMLDAGELRSTVITTDTGFCPGLIRA